MSKSSLPYDDYLISSLRDNEAAQVEFIKASIEENGDMPKAILSALRAVAEARGFKTFAEDVKLNRESLYRALSDDGNPTLESLIKMLDVFGLRISVEPKNKIA